MATQPPVMNTTVHSILNRSHGGYTQKVSSTITNVKKGGDLSKSCPPQISRGRDKVEDITRRKPTEPKNMFELLRKEKIAESSKEDLEIAEIEGKHDDSDDDGDDGNGTENMEKETSGEMKESLSESLYHMLSGIDEKIFTREVVDILHDRLSGYNEGGSRKKHLLETRMDRYNDQIKRLCVHKRTLDSSLGELESKKKTLRDELEDIDREILLARGKSQHTSKKIAKRRESIRNTVLPKIKKLEELGLEGSDTSPLERLLDIIREQGAKGEMDVESLKSHGFDVSMDTDNVLEIIISSEILGNGKNNGDYKKMRSYEINEEISSMDSSVEDSDFDEDGYLSALHSQATRGRLALMEKYAEEINKRYPLSYGGSVILGDHPSIRREYIVPSVSTTRSTPSARVPTYPSYYNQTQDHHGVGESKVYTPPPYETERTKYNDLMGGLDAPSSSISSESSILSSSSSLSSEEIDRYNYWTECSSIDFTPTSEEEEESEGTKARRKRKYIRRKRRIEKLRRDSSFVKEVGKLLNEEGADGRQEVEKDDSNGLTRTLDERSDYQGDCKDCGDCDRGKSLEVDKREQEEEEEPTGRFDSTILNGSLCVSCGRWDKNAYFDKSVHVQCEDSCICADCGEGRETCECPWFFTKEMLLSFQDYNYDFGTKGNKTFPQAVNVRKREFKKRPWLKECNLRDIWKMLRECFERQSVVTDPVELEKVAENLHMYSLIWKNWLRRFVMQKERYGQDNFRVLVTIVYMIMELRLVCKEDPALSPNCCTYCHLPFGPKKEKRKRSVSTTSSPLSLDSTSSQSLSLGTIRPRARSSKTNNLCASCKNFTGDRFVKKYNWVVEAMSLFHIDFGDRLTTKKREKLANIVKQAKEMSFEETGRAERTKKEKGKKGKKRKKSQYHKHHRKSKNAWRNKKKRRNSSNGKTLGSATDDG
jgi:hypothetical protein